MIGQRFTHPKHGKVAVLEKVGRAFALVAEIDRGKGYNHASGAYVGVRFPSGWMRGQNYSYGAEHKVRIDELNPLKP